MKRNESHTFAHKKMRAKFWAVLMLSAIYTVCRGEEKLFIGADLASMVCSGRVRVTAAHAFSDKWSAAAEFTADLKGMTLLKV